MPLYDTLYETGGRQRLYMDFCAYMGAFHLYHPSHRVVFWLGYTPQFSLSNNDIPASIGSGRGQGAVILVLAQDSHFWTAFEDIWIINTRVCRVCCAKEDASGR